MQASNTLGNEVVRLKEICVWPTGRAKGTLTIRQKRFVYECYFLEV